MSKRHPKTILAAFLASMLLYYSVAWALLRCCHEDEPAGVEENMSVADGHGALQRLLVASNQAPVQIDCLDFDYQTEIMAHPASPPQLHRGTAMVARHANDVLILKSLADGHGKFPPGSVFTSGAPPARLSHPPLYLSFAALRI